MIIFVSSCDGADYLFELFARGSWPQLELSKVEMGHAESASEGGGGGGGGSAREQQWRTRGELPLLAGGDRFCCDSAVLGTPVLRLHGQMSQVVPAIIT